MDPDTSQTVLIKVHNTFTSNKSSQASIFKLGVVGVIQDNNGLPVFERGIEDAEQWVYPEASVLEIGSNQTKITRFIIRVPPGAQPGSHHVGLTIEPTSANSVNAIHSRLVSLLTVQVAGQVAERLVLTTWAPKNIIVTDKKWPFDLEIQNKGQAEVSLDGSVIINNWQGREVLRAPIMLGNKVLPGAKRALAPVVSATDHSSLPGLYKARITITYGLTNQTASAIAYIWYFPIWSRIVVGAFFAILLVLIILGIKHKK